MYNEKRYEISIHDGNNQIIFHALVGATRKPTASYDNSILTVWHGEDFDTMNVTSFHPKPYRVEVSDILLREAKREARYFFGGAVNPLAADAAQVKES